MAGSRGFQGLVGQAVQTELARPAPGIVAQHFDAGVAEVHAPFDRMSRPQRELSHHEGPGAQRGAAGVGQARLIEAEPAADSGAGQPHRASHGNLRADHIAGDVRTGHPQGDLLLVLQDRAHHQHRAADAGRTQADLAAGADAGERQGTFHRRAVACQREIPGARVDLSALQFQAARDARADEAETPRAGQVVAVADSDPPALRWPTMTSWLNWRSPTASCAWRSWRTARSSHGRA